jgi:AmiR/NasT family two-component response regulator
MVDQAVRRKPADPAIIGRATAVLMRGYGVDESRAQALLVRIAEISDVPVEVLALRIVGFKSTASGRSWC